MSESVSAEQRFDSETNPCPKCGGGQDQPPGSGERCYGFVLSSGSGYICTEVEGELFNEDADGWLYFYEDDGPKIRAAKKSSAGNGHLTLKQLAKEKQVPVTAFAALGCRDNGRGVLFGPKVRLLPPVKWNWIRGRSTSTDPLFPMPGDVVEEEVTITAGETDMVTVRNAGRAAYAITSGEKKGRSSLTTAHYKALMRRGLQHVTIAPDADEVGQAWGRHEAAAAHAAGLKVSVINLSSLYDPFTKEITDLNDLWQARGCDVDAFLAEVDALTFDLPSKEDMLLEDFLELAEDEIPWVVDGLIAESEIVLVAAPQKSYKTWFTIALCRSFATGTPFLLDEWTVPKKYKVLFIQEEGNKIKFAQRFKTADFKGEVVVRHKQGTDLTSTAFTDTLISDLRMGAYDVLILDPMQRMAPGLNENDSGEMGRFWDNIHKITQQCPGLVVVILHHFNKGQHLGWLGVRGSSRTAGEADVGFFLEKTGSTSINLSIDGRDIPQYLDVDEAFKVSVGIDLGRSLTMTVEGTSTIKVKGPGAPSKEQTVRDLFEANPETGYSKAAVAREVSISPSTAGEHIEALHAEGVITQVSKGKFRRA